MSFSQILWNGKAYKIFIVLSYILKEHFVGRLCTQTLFSAESNAVFGDCNMSLADRMRYTDRTGSEKYYTY